MKTRNPIALVVTRIKAKIIGDKRNKIQANESKQMTASEVQAAWAKWFPETHG